MACSLDGSLCSSQGKASIREVVSRCSEPRLDHTKFLICSTPKLVPFDASRKRNSEHRHRQPGAGRISSTSVVPEPAASRRETPPPVSSKSTRRSLRSPNGHRRDTASIHGESQAGTIKHGRRGVRASLEGPSLGDPNSDI